MNIGVKRIIALTLIVAYIALTAYTLVADKTIPESFVTIVGMVIAYYFGKGSNIKESDKQ